MVNFVKVAVHPETGKVVNPTKNKDISSIRVESVGFGVGNSFVSRRVAFINGNTELLESLGLKAGQQLKGKIIVKQRFTPFFQGQKCKINPTTGEPVLTNGREVFVQTLFTDNVNAVDEIETNNVDEIVYSGEEIADNSVASIF